MASSRDHNNIAASRVIARAGRLEPPQHAGLAVGGDDHRDRYQPARGDDQGRVGGDRYVHRAEPSVHQLGALPWMRHTQKAGRGQEKREEERLRLRKNSFASIQVSLRRALIGLFLCPDLLSREMEEHVLQIGWRVWRS